MWARKLLGEGKEGQAQAARVLPIEKAMPELSAQGQGLDGNRPLSLAVATLLPCRKTGLHVPTPLAIALFQILRESELDGGGAGMHPIGWKRHAAHG